MVATLENTRIVISTITQFIFVLSKVPVKVPDRTHKAKQREQLPTLTKNGIGKLAYLIVLSPYLHHWPVG